MKNMSFQFDLMSGFLFAQDGAAPASGGLPGFLLNPLNMFVIIGILFYFMMIRPERKKRRAAVQMLEELKKNDRVVTIGGICGTIVNVQKDAEEVTIRIDETNNIRVRILRSAISRVIADKGGAEKEVSGKG